PRKRSDAILSELSPQIRSSIPDAPMKALVYTCAWMALVPMLTAQAKTAESEKVDFTREIRPLLSTKCFACHGPDANHREAGLRLDQQANATEELESGSRAVVPGDIAESE